MRALALPPGVGVPIRLREPHGFYNHTAQDLQLMIVGITLEKEKFDVTELGDDLSGR